MEDHQIVNSEWSVEEQVQEISKRLQLLGSLMLAPKLPNFKPGPDDLIVAVPPQNGATWLSHICHQIRVKGQEPEFKNQYEVIYFLEGTDVVNISMAPKQQPAKPNVFLTHLPYPAIPNGGRKIFSFRDQKDAMLSRCHFYNSITFLKGRVVLPIIAQVSIELVEKALNDLVTWWEHRHDSDVMILFYDDLKEDHAGCVRRIAKHMDIVCDEDTIARVVHTTSHAEMSKHSSKFGATHSLIPKLSKAFGEVLPSQSDEIVSRVRKSGGKSGQGKEQLPLNIQQCIDQLWQEIVTFKLGFKNLNEMREAWKKERGN